MIGLLLAAALSAGPEGSLRFICPRDLTEPCELASNPTTPPLEIETVRPPRNLVTEPYLRPDETLPLILGGAAVDAWTALDLLERRDAKELNPLGSSSGKIVSLQFAHAAGGFAAVHIVDRHYGRKWGRRTLIGITALKVVIAAVQLGQAR